MSEAVIIDAIRTPIGRAHKGSLRAVRADELAAVPLRALIERNPKVDFDRTEDIITGCVAGVGEQGYNVARNSALLAGVDHTVPANTVNRFCASSLQAIRMAHQGIVAGEGDQYVAAGVEAVSRVKPEPLPMNPALDGSPGSLYDVYISMGQTAENVAKEYGVSRETQDEWALTSQTRAVEARESGHFDSEIVPVTVPAHEETDKEGNTISLEETVIRRDDGPRPGTSAEGLAALKPVFDENGTVTAGNACPVNDGAAAVLITSGERAEELGLTPRARIHAVTAVGVRPELMGIGPVPAIQLLLERTGKTIDEIDVVEINEAFAAQVVPSRDQLGIDPEKLNPFGGGIALGHPYGMTGARICTTLLNDLETLGGTWGIESMCVGGGMGMAMLVERLG
jgi:acetyl-CoA C-acetyltransferase